MIPLWAKALIVAAILAACAIAVNRFLSYEQKIGYDRAVAEYNVKLIAAQNDARAQEVAWQSQQKKAQEKTNEQLNARDTQYQSAVNTIGSLRNTLANFGNGVSVDTLSACRARESALIIVSGQCIDRYNDLGKAAQGQFIDSVNCRESCPHPK